MSRFLALLLVALCLAGIGWAPSASAAEPMLRLGDESAAVAVWQRRINVWLRASGHAELPVTGVFGERTLRATRELEALSGLPVNGVVGDRTRAALEDATVPVQLRRFEWPVPVPDWFWSWAQWYLHRGPYRDEAFRGSASRPEAAPDVVPNWAWRRLSEFLDRDLTKRAREFVRDRLETRYGAGDIAVQRLLPSKRDPRWLRISGIYGWPVHRIWAVWLDRRDRFGRWHIQYQGLDAAAVQPDPKSRRDPIPCDIRPAFATPRC